MANTDIWTQKLHETTIKLDKVTLVQNLTVKLVQNLTVKLVQNLTVKMAKIGPEPILPKPSVEVNSRSTSNMLIGGGEQILKQEQVNLRSTLDH